MNLAAGISEEPAETTHFSIRDKDGNAVAMTATIEGGFGSKLMVDGFMLNNELTDFSYEYAAKGQTVANRVEPKKRPRSAMAPTLIFDQSGKLEIVVGSPGGAVIPAYVAKTIVALLDWNMTPAEAAAAAEIAPGDTLSLEQGTFLEKEAAAFKALGDPVRVGGSGSGIHVIRIMKDGSLLGGADPRRNGAVVGG
jgi:gamma-glutamyltranspeptidase/glutathione hydrolase